MPADLTEHRAGIQACAAADAIQRLFKRRVTQPGAPIIQDNEMALLAWKWGVDQLCIHTQFLGGRRTSQERQHQRQIVKIADEPLHAHQRDMDRRQRRDHARISLITYDADSTCLRNAEVRGEDVSGEICEFGGQR